MYANGSGEDERRSTAPGSPIITSFCRIVLPDDEGHVTVPFQPGHPFQEIRARVATKLAPKRWFRDGVDAYTFATCDEQGHWARLANEDPVPSSCRVITMVETARVRKTETNFLSGGCVVSGCSAKQARGTGYCAEHFRKYNGYEITTAAAAAASSFCPPSGGNGGNGGGARSL
eukprot:g6319.t1